MWYFKIRINLPLNLLGRAVLWHMAGIVQMRHLCESVLCAQSCWFSPTAILLLTFIFSVWPHALSISHYSKPATNTDLLFFCQSCPPCLLLKSEWLDITALWDAIAICCLWNGDVTQRGSKVTTGFWMLSVRLAQGSFSGHVTLQRGKGQV